MFEMFQILRCCEEDSVLFCRIVCFYLFYHFRSYQMAGRGLSLIWRWGLDPHFWTWEPLQCRLQKNCHNDLLCSDWVPNQNTHFMCRFCEVDENIVFDLLNLLSQITSNEHLWVTYTAKELAAGISVRWKEADQRGEVSRNVYNSYRGETGSVKERCWTWAEQKILILFAEWSLTSGGMYSGMSTWTEEKSSCVWRKMPLDQNNVSICTAISLKKNEEHFKCDAP